MYYRIRYDSMAGSGDRLDSAKTKEKAMKEIKRVLSIFPYMIATIVRMNNIGKQLDAPESYGYVYNRKSHRHVFKQV